MIEKLLYYSLFLSLYIRTFVLDFTSTYMYYVYVRFDQNSVYVYVYMKDVLYIEREKKK